MSTKAQLQTLIDTNLATGQPVTAVLHRDMLKDNTNNILDNMYADEIVDTEITANEFLLDILGSAQFSFKILKQGRMVTVTGNITSDVSNLIQVGQFTTTELQCPLGGNYFTVGKISGSTVVKGVEVFNSASQTRIRIKGGIPNGDTLEFQLIYFTES